ncbi:hypothetical protein MMC26_001644 [Xylographa opegraphella]|nr:hypothetical protein [Xylographa opegraphella]
MSAASRSRPSASSNRPPQADALPPVYQPPAHPLNGSAQRALQNLPRAHDLKRLESHLQAVNDTLSNAAADINDRSYQRQVRLQKAKAKRQQHGLEDTEEDQERAKACERMEAEVRDLTTKMDGKVREMIDAEAHVQAVKEVLGEVQGNVVAGGGAIAPTQSTLGASQFRPRRRDVGSDSEEEGDADSGAGQENVGPSELLKRKLEEHDARYGGLTLRTKYAQHNSYVHFRRLVHDATHPGADAPPLPNASTWFPSDPRDPHLSDQAPPERSISPQDEESDIEIASVRVTVKCPLTLLPMRDPLTSKKCPHSFEKAAILDMLSRSTNWVGGTGRRGGGTQERAMKCPVCEVMLTTSDLYTDPVLVRKIKRLQAAQAADGDDDLDDSIVSRQRQSQGGTQRRAGLAVDSDDEDIDADVSSAQRIKSEGAASRSFTIAADAENEDEEAEAEEDEESARPTPSQGGVIVDMGEETEEAEEEEADEEEE